MTAVLRRILLIGGNTLREASRQRLFQFLLCLALALVVGARWLRDFNFGAPELKFLIDSGLGAIAFFGAALTVTATAQLFFSEIENRTALTLLAKPVGRGEFLLGKFLGVTALVGLFCALLTGLLLAVVWVREGELARMSPEAFAQGRIVSYGAIALAGFLQWLKFAVLCAFGLLIASFAQTQLFTMVMGFLFLVICHLQYLAQDSYAKAGTWAGRMAAAGLAALFPNFQLFSLGDALANGQSTPAAHTGMITLYAAGYAAVACTLAIHVFRRREI
jgi:hypothetical protein